MGFLSLFLQVCHPPNECSGQTWQKTTVSKKEISCTLLKLKCIDENHVLDPSCLHCICAEVQDSCFPVGVSFTDLMLNAQFITISTYMKKYDHVRRVTSDLKCSSESNDEVESTDLHNDTFMNDV